MAAAGFTLAFREAATPTRNTVLPSALDSETTLQAQDIMLPCPLLLSIGAVQLPATSPSHFACLEICGSSRSALSVSLQRLCELPISSRASVDLASYSASCSGTPAVKAAHCCMQRNCLQTLNNQQRRTD